MKKSSIAGNVVLLAATAIMCLLASEIFFRVTDGYRLDSLALAVKQKHDAGTGTSSITFAKDLALDRDFKISWYPTSPRDYDRSNTYKLPADWVSALRKYKPAPGERPFVKEELKFLYNYNWLIQACKTGQQTRVIKHYAENPGFVYAFRSPDSSPAPQYRIVPRGWNEAEDAYNNFGFRGPDISPHKPAHTIRLAFLGASTTVQGWPFTYPEFVAHYLRMWARSQHFDVDFDVINAGRSGLDSFGISKILRWEVAPLHPDVIVYDGGLNDFNPGAYAKTSGNSRRPEVDKTYVRPSLTISSLPLEQYSALLARVYELVFRRGSPQAEPVKPAHQMTFDFGQRDPNIEQSGLPLRLNGQIADARQIEAVAHAIGAQLFLVSATAMVAPGMHLDPERDRYIVDELNTEYWPLTYSEIRQALDFQNNVVRKVALVDGDHFLDVARYFPRDPAFFSDVFHFRGQDGERLQGWIVAQLLAPYLKNAIKTHELPKPGYDPSPQSLAWVDARPIKFDLACLRK